MCGDHAAAMKCYIMAGAIDSLFFEKDVSPGVWSQQVLFVLWSLRKFQMLMEKYFYCNWLSTVVIYTPFILDISKND